MHVKRENPCEIVLAIGISGSFVFENLVAIPRNHLLWVYKPNIVTIVRKSNGQGNDTQRKLNNYRIKIKFILFSVSFISNNFLNLWKWKPSELRQISARSIFIAFIISLFYRDIRNKYKLKKRRTVKIIHNHRILTQLKN